MEYILSAAQMQRLDKQTTENYQIPSCVLMERAALAVAGAIKKRFSTDKKILVIAGSGNNGGDGIAAARLLLLDGYHVDIMPVTSSSGIFSEENSRQKNIFIKYGGSIQTRPNYAEYDMIVDALFGVGLNRPLSDQYRGIAEAVNRSSAYVMAVDIPSGISADTGEVLGCAVRADKTIAFGYRKKGHVLFPGCTYAGEVEVADVGICRDELPAGEPYMFTADFTGRQFLPDRMPQGNKGTFGKLLVAAGSKETAGAAIMSSMAAFRMGCGMVRLITHQANRDAVLSALPECMTAVYTDEASDREIRELAEEGCRWADAVLLGPGMGTGHAARLLTEECLLRHELPAVIDADAVNIMAQDRTLYKDAGLRRKGRMVMTPHMGELARFISCSVQELSANREAYVRQTAEQLHGVLVSKDARTFVSDGSCPGMYCNLTGNHGMATAGSGDILAGMAAVLLMQEKHAFEAAVKAVWLHGYSGDIAAGTYGKRSLKATDLIESLCEVIKQSDKAGGVVE